MTAKTAAGHDGISHTAFEDAMAIAIGVLFLLLGVQLLKTAGLGTGGTAGIAFLIHYATGWPFGLVFFTINLPFYFLALKVFGRAYLVKTIAAVVLLSFGTEALPKVIEIGWVNPLFAAIAGGWLIGIGLLALIRHRSGVGGLGVLAVYLQESRGLRAGKVQMALDALIVAAAFAVVPWQSGLLSIVGVVSLNIVLALNHKPGRYAGY